MVTVDHKRRKGLGPKQSLVFAAFADSSLKASSTIACWNGAN